MMLKSKWITFGIIAVLGWMGISFIRINTQADLVNTEVLSLENKVKDMENSNSSLERFISYIKYPSFLEKEARSKLNYKISGEEVAFIYPDASVKSSSSPDFYNQLAQMPNYIKWVYYLLGY